MQKIVTLVIREEDMDRALELRYLLADTIEHRKLGEIINEGTGMGFTEVSFITNYTTQKAEEIKSLVQALGLLNVTEIEVEEME